MSLFLSVFLPLFLSSLYLPLDLFLHSCASRLSALRAGLLGQSECRYLLRNSALEFFLTDQSSYFFNFPKVRSFAILS